MTGSKEEKRTLVRAPNWVGDAVMTLPALRCLKALYPDDRITVLARKRVRAVYENNPAVDGIVEYGEDARGLVGRLRLSARLRRMRFQRAVLFQNAFDAAFISFLARIPERIGYARDLRSGLLTTPVPFTDKTKKLHHVRYYLGIIEALGGRCGEEAPRIFITEKEKTWAGRFLCDMGLSGMPLVGAAPGASYGPAKRWPAARFGKVLASLAAALDGAALVFGAQEDAMVCGEVVKAVPSGIRTVNLAGRISLREFTALLPRLRVFITNDSGPMHLGAATGVPTVAIFGSTDPSLTGPPEDVASVVMKKVDCSPCFDRKCRYGHYRCLTEITTDEVFSVAAGRAGLGLP